MQAITEENNFIKWYVSIDDFNKEIQAQLRELRLPVAEGQPKKRNRKCSVSDSEIMTILVGFQSGYFTNFKHYYTRFVAVNLKHLFPTLPSYSRFIQLQHRVIVPLAMYLKFKAMGKCTGISFVDSTALPVCHNARIHQHKTFKNFAERGKTSVGWFYGFKLHLIINDKGELLSFYLSRGNVDDRNVKLMKKMTEKLFGKIFGDRGYVSQFLADLLWNDGVQLIAKPRKNMKNNLSPKDRILLRKRAIIECVNDELKNICNLQHTRHRTICHYCINVICALIAYSFFPKKPSLNIQFNKPNPQLTLSA